MSSISYLALPGQAYLSNWNAFVFSLSLPVASLIAVRFFVPLYRSVNSPSAYTYLERRFGPWAKTYASMMYLLTQLMRAGTILFLLALPLHALLGWNITLIIVITGLSVMVYSLLGGIQAVAWTDAIQAIILIAGAVICTGYLLFSMPEGPEQLFEIAFSENKFSLGSFSSDLTTSTFWVVLIYGLFIGTALFSYYKANEGILPAGVDGDQVFPFFIVNQLPAGLTGLLIASIFAAGMSTISTSYNSSATVILTDFFKLPENHPETARKSMRILYSSSFLFSILSILIAIAMINVKSALDAWWKLASIFSGGMLGLFLLGYLAPKVKNRAAIIGVVAGVLVIGWMSLSPIIFTNGEWPNYVSPFHSYLTIVFGTLTIFITGFLIGNGINTFYKRKRK